MLLYSHPITSLIQNNLLKNKNFRSNYKNNFTEKIMSKTNMCVGVCYTILLGVTFIIFMIFIVRAETYGSMRFPSKLGCVVRMVVGSILPHAECGPNDHRKDAPPFTERVFSLNGQKSKEFMSLFLSR